MGKLVGDPDGNYDRFLREVERRLGNLERVAPETPHIVGATGQPAFANSWVVFSASFTATFFVDLSANIHLSGRIKSGTLGSAAFTLPTGHRPLQTRSFFVADAVDGGIVTVNTDGTVVPEATCSNTWVSLDGIHFRAQV